MNKKTASKKGTYNSSKKGGNGTRTYSKKSEWWEQRKMEVQKPVVPESRELIGPKPAKVSVDLASFNFDTGAYRFQDPKYDIMLVYSPGKANTSCYISLGRYFSVNNLRFSSVAFGGGMIDGNLGLVALFDSKAPHSQIQAFELRRNNSTSTSLQVRSIGLVLKCLGDLGLSVPLNPKAKLKVFCSVKPLDINGEKHAYQVILDSKREFVPEED